MKKRVAIVISGQMRSNGLNPNFTHDNLILESVEKYFLNEEFKNQYDYDVFISTDQIDINKTQSFFGDHLKNVHIIESDWYMENIEDKPHNYSYYHDKYLNNIANYFNDYPNHIHGLYMFYRMYCAYKMTQHHQKKTNTHYDYFVKLRPDSRLMQNIYPIFELLENSSKYIFMEHDHLVICKKELRDIFDIVEYYGTYKQNINNKKYIYCLHYFKFVEIYSDQVFRFTPEKQFMDHIYYLLMNMNVCFSEAIYAVTYPCFNLLYRTDCTYGHIPDTHPIYHEENHIWNNPVHGINYLKNSFDYDTLKLQIKYPIINTHVLFITHKKRQCFLYLLGLELVTILKRSNNVNYILCEVENYTDYMYVVSLYKYDLVFYNYSSQTLPWLTADTIQRHKKNIAVQYELEESDIFDITLRMHKNLPESENRINISGINLGNIRDEDTTKEIINKIDDIIMKNI